MCSRTMRSKTDTISDNFSADQLSARMRHLCLDGGIAMAHRRAPRTPWTAALPVYSMVPTAGLTDSRRFGSFTISPPWLLSCVSTDAPVGLCSNAASPLGHLLRPTTPQRSAPAVGASTDGTCRVSGRGHLGLPRSLLTLPTGSPRVTCCSIHSTTVAMGIPTAPHAIEAVRSGRRFLHRWHLSRLRTRSSRAASQPPDTVRWQP